MRKDSIHSLLGNSKLVENLLFQVLGKSIRLEKSLESYHIFSGNTSTNFLPVFIFHLGGAISKPLVDLTVAESQKAVFECEVANPDAKGQWLREGKPISFTDSIKSEAIGAKRQLIIPISKLEDIGEYTYQVATSKTSAKLKVEG